VSQPMNLVVYLARSGVGSRRSCDELVRDGAVTVNGEVVTFPRQKIGEGDVVAINGEPVEPRELKYLLVNKPRGVASTRRDPHADRVIVDMVPNGRMLFPVGRLDVDTTGLIVLTNDGVLANRLMHPRYGVPKTYAARVKGKVSRRALSALRQGVELEDGLTAPAEVNLRKQSAKTALVEITIHEGRKRQVRRMFAAVGLPVEELHRRRYGPIADKGLEPGGFRELAGDEVEALRRAGEEVAESVSQESEGPPVLLAAEATPALEEERPVADATAPDAGTDRPAGPVQAGPESGDESEGEATHLGSASAEGDEDAGERVEDVGQGDEEVGEGVDTGPEEEELTEAGEPAEAGDAGDVDQPSDDPAEAEADTAPEAAADDNANRPAEDEGSPT
jgi:23S rRNA pseudouridine2605 synthase